jgi:hypothetical protein
MHDFKDEYILGSGYPYFDRGSFPLVFNFVALLKRPIDIGIDHPDFEPMDRPRELETLGCPKYELILRKVEK